jgi:hypothetical protein
VTVLVKKALFDSCANQLSCLHSFACLTLVDSDIAMANFEHFLAMQNSEVVKVLEPEMAKHQVTIKQLTNVSCDNK